MHDSEIVKTIEKDGVTKRVEVKKAENGYVTKITKSWMEDDGYDNKEYKEECKYWISKTNPLEMKKKKVSSDKKEPKTIGEAIKDLKI